MTFLMKRKDNFVFVLLTLSHGDCAAYDKALVLDALHTLRERQKITWKVMNSLKRST